MTLRATALWGVLLTALVGSSSIGWAQDEAISCDAFYKNPDGSWTATQSVFIHGTDLMSRVGGVFRPGVPVRGYDVAAALDKACPHPATAPPPPQSQFQPTGTSLLKYADANGTIDLTMLTCGQVADAPEREIDLLLAWYSGPLLGVPNKRPMFNLPTLRMMISNAVGFCKSHREQGFLTAIDGLRSKLAH